MSWRRIVCMLSLVAIGLPIAQARAKLPKSASKTIVVGKSIGGVRIDAKLKTVGEKWGKAKGCGAKYTFACDYRGTLSQGSAQVVHLGGKVMSIRIKLGADGAGQPAFSGPMTKYKTVKGIGLGSTEAELRAAYPSVYRTAADALAFGAPGKVRTFFGLYQGRVSEITIAR